MLSHYVILAGVFVLISLLAEKQKSTGVTPQMKKIFTDPSEVRVRFLGELFTNFRTYAWTAAFCFLVQIVLWTYDTSLAVSPASNSAPIEASRGAKIPINAPIRFSSTRQCSMLISRYILDSNGAYFDLMATRFVSSTGLIEIERASPMNLRFVAAIPQEAALGKGFLVTQVSSMCNPLQIVWPADIDIQWTL